VKTLKNTKTGRKLIREIEVMIRIVEMSQYYSMKAILMEKKRKRERKQIKVVNLEKLERKLQDEGKSIMLKEAVEQKSILEWKTIHIFPEMH
jgi:hypothetical protein